MERILVVVVPEVVEVVVVVTSSKGQKSVIPLGTKKKVLTVDRKQSISSLEFPGQ